MRQFAVLCVVSLVCLASGRWVGTAWAAEEAEKAQRPSLRVGAFDSRALVVAYVRTPEFNAQINRLTEERKKAKAAGDEEKVKRLEAEGKARQQQVHEQGFGAAPIDDILATIKDKLPQIAKEAGVDLIVSKWDVVYQAPGAEVIDITSFMVAPFNPDDRAKRIIKDLGSKPPIPLEELRKLKDL